MKKNVRKLTLNRETLLDLTTAKVEGGVFYRDPGDGTSGGTGPVWTGPFYPGCPSYGNYCTMGC